MANADPPGPIVSALLPLLRRFCIGEHGIALGGAHAKGVDDSLSDIDVYVFAPKVLPCVERSALTEAHVGSEAKAISWGEDSPFREGGTDFWYAGRKVECWLRHTAVIEETIAAGLEGNIRRDFVRWTVMGYFSYVPLSDVHAMRIVEDPHGILEGWKERVRVYPEPLRDAILARFFSEARFWPDNFHYRTAVERCDVIYTTGIVQQVVQALVQVAFAANRVYFPGEKKLAAALRLLPATPRDFVGRVQALLYAGSPPTTESLEAQRRELVSLVGEVGRIAGIQG
jgi:hypothetical protein